MAEVVIIQDCRECGDPIQCVICGAYAPQPSDMREERRAIVRWLRRLEQGPDGWRNHFTCSDLAARIEEGEHLA